MTWKPYHYARKNIRECDKKTLISDVARMFTKENIGSVLVRDDDGEYEGLLTDWVLFRALAEGRQLTGKTVGDLEIEPMVRVDEDMGFEAIKEEFKKSPSERLVIVDKKGKVVGILKRKMVERFSVYEQASRMLKK